MWRLSVKTLSRESKGVNMIVTTANEIEGRDVCEYLGLVRGIVVRTPTVFQGIAGGLKSLVGGNIEAFADACETARQQAYDRMIQHAEELEADAIIAMRYDATGFAQNATEVLAYGTAVRLR